MKGIVYKIVGIDPETKEELVYIGSTTRPLKARISRHKDGCKRWLNGKSSYTTSFSIVSLGEGNYTYEVIEEVEFEDIDELFYRERYYIQTIKCVNKCIPLRTQKEYREEHKEEMSEYFRHYRQEHKEELAEKSKQYREDNKERISENKKQYRKSHKKEISERDKQYYERNKPEISRKQCKYYEKNSDRIKDNVKKWQQQNKARLSEKRAKKVCCIQCGNILTRGNISRHYVEQHNYDKGVRYNEGEHFEYID